MMPSRELACGARYSRKPLPKETSSRLSTPCKPPLEGIEHVAHSHCASPSSERHRCHRRSSALLRAGAVAQPRRCLSRSESAGNLCCSTVWRNEPTADGRIHLVLLRVSLPLYQRHRERRSQIDSGRRIASPHVPSRNQYERGAGANYLLRESRTGIYASGHCLALRDSL